MVYGKLTYQKHYVEVLARYCLDGRCEPTCIFWEDGKRFEITEVLRSGRARCLNTSGIALRYEVRISGKIKYLFRDQAGWFVEVLEDSAFVATGDPRCYGG